MAPGLILAWALRQAAAPQALRFDDTVFGPRRMLRCTWFTTFENSRFHDCRDVDSPVLRAGEAASIRCLPKQCARLDGAARRWSGGKRGEPPTGFYTVRFVGRVAADRHAPRFLGDGTRTILVETVTAVRRAD
ncbi:hypothetical protein [Sphingomonas elodea]|uniref:hypothetical protein n=1 Tax=Sphingomonas elodea TaxID=179878 RepID=UPI0002631AC6|nr:hypothetical protein [Sphingomonas elodea]